MVFVQFHCLNQSRDIQNIQCIFFHSLFFLNIDAMFLFLSILTVNIAAMLLNLDPDIVRSGPRLHSTCSKQYGRNASSSADEKKIC